MLMDFDDLTHCDLALAYEYGDLSPEEMVYFENHLDGCWECQDLLRDHGHWRVPLLPWAR